MTEALIPLGVIATLVFLNGIFVAAEFSLIASPRTLIAKRALQGSRPAQHIQKIHSSAALQNRYLATAQIGITLVSLGLGMYGEHTIADWLVLLFENMGTVAEAAAHTVATLLSVGLLTYVHVVIGEMVAKSLALQRAVPTALLLDRPMNYLGTIFSPLVWLLNNLGNAITHALGVTDVQAKERMLTPDELEFIVEESSASGLLASSEALFIENIFDLQERDVSQVMTPRTHIAGIPSSANLEEALRLACETKKTRYPVFEEDLDRIKGVIHVKDLARTLDQQPSKNIQLGTITRPTAFVPESLSIYDLLLRFRRERLQFAVVLDEFGGTAGIITLEDLVEEVVGEIQDEYDTESLPIENISVSLLRVRGDVILDEINQYANLNLEHPDANTVGGLVMAILGRIPRPYDKVSYQGVIVEVESMEKRAVKRALVYLPAQQK